MGNAGFISSTVPCFVLESIRPFFIRATFGDVPAQLMRARRGALANGYSQHIFEQCEGTPLLESHSSASICSCLNHVQSNISRIITMRLAIANPWPLMQNRRAVDAARVSAADSQKRNGVGKESKAVLVEAGQWALLSSWVAHELQGLR